MNKIKNIGLCFPKHFKFYTHEVVEGMIPVAAENTCIHFKDLRFMSLDMARNRLRSSRVDGLIIGLNKDEYACCQQDLPHDVPIVNVHPDLLSSEIPTVAIDYVALAHLAVDYLMGLGYRNVACLGAAGARSSEELAREIASAATEAGILCSYFNIYMHPGFYENLAAEQDPEFCAWVENLPMATAVVTTGGYTALLLEQTAAAVGRNVPAELAVLSISDDEVCLFADPPISSFYSAGKDIGRMALTIINDTLNGVKHPCGKQLLPPPAIIERRSTGFPAGMDEGTKRALRFIKEHACEGISVDDVVRHVRIMGRTRLYNQIKRYLGRSPAAEIMRLRIARAQQLLATTNLPVTRIVDACGFNSHAQFSVTFRRETGVTATAFRKKNSG